MRVLIYTKLTISAITLLVKFGVIPERLVSPLLENAKHIVKFLELLIAVTG